MSDNNTGVNRSRGRLTSAWQKLRKHRGYSLLIDVTLILVVFFAVHAWQTRNLPVDEAAPETVLALLDGSGAASAVQSGKAGIVYFFAPWCYYCKTSIDNLYGMVSSGAVAWGTAVALDYGDTKEVEAFVNETGVSIPVLLGNAGTASDWSVRAFPTYYVINADGKISSRSVGYSTWLGMSVRAWMANI